MTITAKQSSLTLGQGLKVGFSQFPAPCPFLLNNCGGDMCKHYVVEREMGGWGIFYREQGQVGRLVAVYPTKLEADVKADRGNLIIQGAEQQFLVGAR